MNNVLVRENYSLDNGTLPNRASNSDNDMQDLASSIIVLILFILLIIYLFKEKIDENRHSKKEYIDKIIDKYSMDIKWSTEDNVFIVTVPELPGCKTHGSTYEEAVQQGKYAIESWIEASQAWGDPIPSPSGMIRA